MTDAMYEESLSKVRRALSKRSLGTFCAVQLLPLRLDEQIHALCI